MYMNIFDNIFPKYCLICSKIGKEICDNCMKKVPHTLPSCCICNKLSNGYFTHKECSEIRFQCFTGLYISNNLKSELEKKINLGIYSTHMYILNRVINRFTLDTIIKNSEIYPIESENRKTNILNKKLATKLRLSKERKREILLVGNSIENKDNLLQQVKGLCTEPFNLRILVLLEEPLLPKFIHR